MSGEVICAPFSNEGHARIFSSLWRYGMHYPSRDFMRMGRTTLEELAAHGNSSINFTKSSLHWMYYHERFYTEATIDNLDTMDRFRYWVFWYPAELRQWMKDEKEKTERREQEKKEVEEFRAAIEEERILNLLKNSVQLALPEPVIEDVASVEETQETERNRRGGYVYLLHAAQVKLYKIGKAVKPDVRESEISVKMPFPIKRVHLIKCENRHTAERVLHERYADQRVRGEWFRLTPAQVNEIKQIEEM